LPFASSTTTTGRPYLRIIGDQELGVIRGRSVPGAEIEAVNLSVAPNERILPNETLVIAKADEHGLFETGRLPVRESDLIRLRARVPTGAASKSRTFRVRGVGGRPRRQQVALFRVGLRDLGNGTVKVFSINRGRPLAEPGAILWFTNTRTGERVKFVMNIMGSIEGRTRVPGKGGDVFRIEIETRISSRFVGTLLTPLIEEAKRSPDEIVRPGPLHQRLGFIPTVRRIRAPLFRGRRPRPFDVYQSELANCYIASAAAAVAQVRPACLARAIVPLGGGEYRVRFKARDSKTGRYAARSIVVTSDLYVRPSGPLLYGSTGPTGLEQPTSLWWPLLEKAFAHLKGSYKEIGYGGASHHILEALLGRRPRHFYTDLVTLDDLWSELVQRLEARIPVVVGTFPMTSARRYRCTGLHPDHAYAVLSVREVRGVKKIGLRNPWGEDVGRPGRVRRKGFLEIDLDKFPDLIEVVSTVR
jgi:hypothetical protein